MNKKVDLNCDIGESFALHCEGSPKVFVELDDRTMRVISSANVACGYHAGDPVVMEEVITLCKRCNVAVGAHPGLPDMAGFGRRKMALTPLEARNYVLYQMGALRALCEVQGIELQHVKAHGAFYHMLVEDELLGNAVIDGLTSLKSPPILLTQTGSDFARRAEEAGLVVRHEAFVDRAYNNDGRLIPRDQRGAVIHDPGRLVEQALQIVLEEKAVAPNGRTVRVRGESLCIHGDHPEAAENVLALKEAFSREGIEIVPLKEL